MSQYIQYIIKGVIHIKVFVLIDKKSRKMKIFYAGNQLKKIYYLICVVHNFHNLYGFTIFTYMTAQKRPKLPE